jgi:hypothetical protein
LVFETLFGFFLVGWCYLIEVLFFLFDAVSDDIARRIVFLIFVIGRKKVVVNFVNKFELGH